MNTSRTLVNTACLAVLVALGGCAAWGTGVVPQTRANGDATAPNSRLRSSAPVDPNIVVSAQRALSRYGYDPGPADGMFNASTRDAVLQFQRARGIRATGELDSQTVAALGVGR
jgi:peptidoglycan hydrolase-like protein with peptidoglycan-binding domain